MRPTPGAVSRAAHAAQQALGAWSRAHGAASAHRDGPRLALRLAREVAKDPVAWASGELLLSTHSSGVQVKEEQVEEEGQALGAQQVAGGGDVAPRHPRTLLNAAGEVAYVLVEGGGDVAADGEAARREEVVEAGAMDVDAGGGGEGAAASGEQQVQGQAEHDAAGDTGGEARRAAERVDGLPQLLPPPRQAAAGGGGEGAGGAVEPLPAGVSLEQVRAGGGGTSSCAANHMWMLGCQASGPWCASVLPPAGAGVPGAAAVVAPEPQRPARLPLPPARPGGALCLALRAGHWAALLGGTGGRGGGRRRLGRVGRRRRGGRWRRRGRQAR